MPHYVRLYAGPDGHSHFEDVTLETTRERDTELSDLIPVDGLRFRRVTGTVGAGVHRQAPRPQVIVHLTGEVEVRASDGETRRFGPGDVVLVEDITGHGHVTRPVGDRGDRTTLVAPLADPR